MIKTMNMICALYSYYLSTYVMFFMLSFTMNVTRFCYPVTIDISFNVDKVAVAVRHRKGASVNVLTSLSLTYVNLKPSYYSRTTLKYDVIGHNYYGVLYFQTHCFSWVELTVTVGVLWAVLLSYCGCFHHSFSGSGLLFWCRWLRRSTFRLWLFGLLLSSSTRHDHIVRWLLNEKKRVLHHECRKENKWMSGHYYQFFLID